MCRNVRCIPIRGIREIKDIMFQPTYCKFPIPDMKTVTNLKGDFSWLSFFDIKVEVDVKDSSWKTFKVNKHLWEMFLSVTDSYTDIIEDNVEAFGLPQGRVIFYRDQQDCVIWSVDPKTGKVFEDGTDFIVADDVEEFMLHKFVESYVWMKIHSNTYNHDKENHIVRRYVQFYLDNK